MIDDFQEKLEPVRDMVDKVYRILKNDELIYLEDFVPPLFLSNYAYSKREEWIIENEKFLLNDLDIYHNEEILDCGTVNEKIICTMKQMKEFIKNYPQYSKLIIDSDAFEEYYEKLEKELEEHNENK